MTKPIPAFADLERACREAPPLVALVLGSGLGPVADRARPELSVPFAAIPGLPASSVLGHKGRVTLGELGGARVLLFEGRLHFYEGHPWEVVTRPIRLAARLGARVALLTNASGGIRPDLGPGALMALRDQLDCTRPSWWRSPAPASPYSDRLRKVLVAAGAAAGVSVAEGTYAALTGPCYETPAEIRALRAWGADAVGMSTAREALAAVEEGMECVALSVVANRAAGLSEAPLSHEEVLAVARAQGERTAGLLERALAALVSPRKTL